MNTEHFIKEVQSRPAIWKFKHPHYKRKTYHQKMWLEIHKLFPDLSVLELKKKWKNLKDTYRKELKKDLLSNSSYSQSSWVHFGPLDFLRNECRAQMDDVPEDEEANNVTIHDDQSGNSDNDLQEIGNSANSSPLLVPRSSQQPQENYKRKSKFHQELGLEHLEIEKKKLKILEREISNQNNESRSDNYYFLMSILPEMDKLGPVQKFRLRNNINKALMEEMTMGMNGNPSGTMNIDPLICKQPETAKPIKEEVDTSDFLIEDIRRVIVKTED